MTSGDSSTATGATFPAVIRLYDSSDRAAIREICRQAASEQPDPIFHADLELAPLLLADYYLDYEPEQCFVAEVDGRVVGYMLASKNTEDCVRTLRRRILPRVALRLLWKVISLQFGNRSTYKALWWKLVAGLGSHRGGELALPVHDYPAHSHRNVHPAYRGRGIGDSLSVKQHDHLREQGIKGMHAVLVESAGNDVLTRELCGRRGYELVATKPHAVLTKMTGRDYVLKLLVCDLEKEARNAASAAARVSDLRTADRKQ
jgi:GNAT superfamily N-acetyltransferase